MARRTRPTDRGWVDFHVWLRPAERESIRNRASSRGMKVAELFRSTFFPALDPSGRPVDPSSAWLSRKISREEATAAHDALSYGADQLDAEARGMRRIDPGNPRAAAMESAALDWRASARIYRRIVEDYDALEAARQGSDRPRTPSVNAKRPVATPALAGALSLGRGDHRAPVA